jgi:predicted neutral ceramidase superfamily lipid hydrolase
MKNSKVQKSGYKIKLLIFFSKFIDFPSAIAGAVLMGLIVGAINFGHGWWPAATSAMKQAAYTFLFGGMMIRLLYRIVLAIPGKTTSLIIAVISVSILTIILVYLVHNLRGTPMPFESTLPTVILAPVGFSFLAFRKKKHSAKSPVN